MCNVNVFACVSVPARLCTHTSMASLCLCRECVPRLMCVYERVCMHTCTGVCQVRVHMCTCLRAWTGVAAPDTEASSSPCVHRRRLPVLVPGLLSVLSATWLPGALQLPQSRHCIWYAGFLLLLSRVAFY